MSIAWLFETQKNRICLGLESMALLLEKLGHPEKKLQVLHVAGTNGKGSVSAFAESVLRAEGYLTGLYTSPHLIEINERIRINGENITQACLEEGIERLQFALRGLEKQPTFFELTTALAFDVFARARLDVVVLETGLGGRLDATNVAPKLACAITSISLDHMEYLGPTLAHIAREKAGIMRKDIPVISVPQPSEAHAVLITEAKKVRAPLEFVTDPLSERCELGLAGSYQRWNAALALALVKKAGFKISSEAQKMGLEKVSWPGRFQKILIRDANSITRTIILDGAHNPAAAESLVQTWKEEFPNQSCALIFGALADKQGSVMLESLKTIAKEVFLVPIASPRTALPEDLLPLFSKIKTFSSLEEAFKQLFFDKKDSSFLFDKVHNIPILLAGSLFLVGEALALLQGKEYRSSMQ
ncbi:MAG: bifunctional folylpolyglutamate synthase/dihydrofolate synthase [Chthoniobacterales bacterium]